VGIVGTETTIGLRNICNAAKHRILLTAARSECHISSTCIASKKLRLRASISAPVPKGSSEDPDGRRAASDG